MNRQTHGFTLIEIMVTLAVIAIIAILGIPQLQGMSANNRLTGQINTITRDLSFARSEAIKRGVRIRVVAASGTANWQPGWSVSALANDGVTPIVPALRATAALTTGGTILTGPNAATNYLPDGSVISTAAFPWIFTLCDNRGNAFARQISLSRSGQSRLVDPPAPTVACP